MVLPLVNALALFAAGYFLRDSLDAPPPPTTPYQEPYTPPFLGGQCNKIYRVNLRTRRDDGFEQDWGTYFGQAPIQFVGLFGSEAEGLRIGVRFANGAFPSPNIGVYQPERYTDLSTWVPNDGSPDNCGNLPNPNPEFNPNDTGLAGGGFNPSAEPNTELAAPIVPFLPSFLAALNAALAAAAAAANALEGIKAVADAIAAIADLLKKIRDDLNEKEKEKDKNKEVLSYEFGRIEKDGFLRLYPSDSFADCEAVQLDVIVTAIPLGYGKYFGKFSPNYFEYKRLGHIAFVSGSFGIIERKFIEFGRSSFTVPKGSVGFYYHLGLDGVIKANASALYLREVEQIE